MHLQQDLRVRDLDPGAVAFAADLHRRALPSGFFCRLGPRFLRGYYRTFVTGPHAVALLAEADGRPAGVLVGTVDNAAHYRWTVRQEGPHLAALGAAGLLGDPKLLGTFLQTRAGGYARAVARRVRPGPAGVHVPAERIAVLTHLAVAEGARDRGLGARLVAAFVAAASAGGADHAALVTLAGPRGAGPFYERLGWTAVDERPDRDGHRVMEYRLPLSAP